jgi:hypothetical protein
LTFSDKICIIKLLFLWNDNHFWYSQFRSNSSANVLQKNPEMLFFSLKKWKHFLGEDPHTPFSLETKSGSGNHYNAMLFTVDLVSKHETLLQSIFTESDVYSKLPILNDALLSTLQTHAPVKTIRVCNRPCPYITQNIKDLAHRDQLHRQFKFSRDVGDWTTYKNARQSVKNIFMENYQSLHSQQRKKNSML